MYTRPDTPPLPPTGDGRPSVPAVSDGVAVPASNEPMERQRPPRIVERVIAATVHLLVLFLLPGSLVAWMIWMLSRRRSPFISYHARQAVLWQSLSNIVFVVLLAIAFISIFTSLGMAVNDAHTHDTTSVPVLISSFFGLFALIVISEVFFWISAFFGAAAALLGMRYHYPVVNRRKRARS